MINSFCVLGSCGALATNRSAQTSRRRIKTCACDGSASRPKLWAISTTAWAQEANRRRRLRSAYMADSNEIFGTYNYLILLVELTRIERATSCPFVFCDGNKPIGDFRKAWKNGLQESRPFWDHRTRSQAHSCAKHGACRYSRAYRNGVDGPQNAKNLRSLQHRQKRRSRGRRGATPRAFGYAVQDCPKSLRSMNTKPERECI
jgi:hypothetical protein